MAAPLCSAMAARAAASSATSPSAPMRQTPHAIPRPTRRSRSTVPMSSPSAGALPVPARCFRLGAARTVLSGISTYTGPTMVDAGTLVVAGSIISQVTVNSGGVLSGSGVVGNTTINGGGLLAPANPGGALTVQGNLLLPPLALIWSRSDRPGRPRQCHGQCDAGRRLVSRCSREPVFSSNILFSMQPAGVTGTFAGVDNLAATVAGSLSYDSNDAFLNLSLNYAAGGAFNTNQHNVGNALTSSSTAPAAFPLPTPHCRRQHSRKSQAKLRPDRSRPRSRR